MSTFDWPLTAGFLPEQFSLDPESRTLASESILSGSVQTSGTPGMRFKCHMVLPSAAAVDRAAVEGFLSKLNGREHRVRLWHFTRPGVGGYGYPMGSINQNGVTVSVAAAQFASTITLAGCGANKTLQAGDFFSVNGQLLLNPDTVVANGSGVMVLPAISRLRVAAAAGQAVTLVRPYSTFVMDSNSYVSSYVPGANQPIGLDFTEVFT
jgi:hypothetical protein